MAYFWTDQDEGSSKATERTTADTKKGMVRTTTKFRQIQLEKTNESIENLFLGKKTAMQWKRVFLATKTYGTQKNNEKSTKKG